MWSHDGGRILALIAMWLETNFSVVASTPHNYHLHQMMSVRHAYYIDTYWRDPLFAQMEVVMMEASEGLSEELLWGYYARECNPKLCGGVQGE